MARPDWYRPLEFQSELYVGGDLFFDVNKRIHLNANTMAWGEVTLGLLGPMAINSATTGILGTRSYYVGA